MITAVRLAIAFGLLAAGVAAQEPGTATPPEPRSIPSVHINEHSVSLQQSIFPEYYRTHSAIDDIAWVTSSNREIETFIRDSADSLLHLLSTLSGLSWRERELGLYFVRYLPSTGSSDPLLLPVGGIRQGGLVEAMPSGAALKLNLIYYLADRMLSQSAGDTVIDTTITNHPLMQYLPYRRELLTLLLAVETGRQLLGSDSTRAAYESPFWIRHVSGRRIFEEYFLTKWSLSSERPLSHWLAEQPIDSDFVNLTGVVEFTVDEPSKVSRQYIEGLPLKGQFGFSVKLNSGNNLVVERIDESRLAFLCGLRRNDVIKQVNGKRPRSQKELVEMIVAGFDVAGTFLQISREGKAQTILLRPVHRASGTDSTQSKRDSI